MIKMCFRLLSILLLLVCSVGTSYGQYSMPVTTSFKTPYGNVPYTYYTTTPYRMYGNQQGYKTKYKFTVVLKNDSTFIAKTKISIEKNENNFITVKSKGNKQTLFPADTKSISRITFEGQQLLGIAADSCWLFKTASGKINTYSAIAEPGMEYNIAIQEGDTGPIVPLTKENLLYIVGNDDPKVSQLIEKGKLIKAIVTYNGGKD